ncbi:MAG: 3-phosphoshikimate 1-carboxyvinyltransferase [Candidatus Omnitrophica bacterium]|nr:3-phosphoshikimate 1-carboxyvinyltransferase [Candidatus Omnitrophota bacterium]
MVKDKIVPHGRIILDGDKSIAHRALIIGALSFGKTTIHNFPVHDDSLATLGILESLGVKITRCDKRVLVFGGKGFKGPKKALFAGDSGTTLRLMLGVLAGAGIKARVCAGKYLSARPMARVNVPLRLMGAKISARKVGKEEYPPVVTGAGRLKGITYRLPVASAQVKSAILLAGLFAEGATRVIEDRFTRDHTERMLKHFGADIVTRGNTIILRPGRVLNSPGDIYIPGDISSAAFFIVLALIMPGSRIVIERLGLNPGRAGIIKVLKRMGARIRFEFLKGGKYSGLEPIGNITVSGSKLKATVVERSEIPSLIDELPVFMVAACFAQGRTVIKGADELRVKETDRINSMVTNLKAMGADIRLAGSGSRENIIINGKGRGLTGASLKSFGDHRTAMSVIIATLAAKGLSRLDDIGCISKSFPGFLTVLKSLFR